MDSISKTDRLVQLLRLRLEERVKARTTAHGQKISTIQSRRPDAAREIAGEFVRAGVDDRYLRRSLVEQLLADQFGSNLVNDAKFQQIIDQVTEVMAADEQIGALFDDVLARLGE